MDDFRYPHSCPLARATEVLGHRWVFLILRELWAGPQRFADLKRRLRGVSPSVLTERLALLEAQSIIERQELPPPAASKVYVLTPDGEALRPVLIELTRWGLRRLLPAKPGDHMEPDWIALAVDAFGVREACPPDRLELRVRMPDGTTAYQFKGGERGLERAEADGPVDIALEGEPMPLLAAMSGLVPPDQLEASGVLVEGNRSLVAALPSRFHFDFGAPAQ
jgi:DNA-binding HxlR family transcriptional regulator